MTRPIVLKVVGSSAACSFLGRLVQTKPQDPDSAWVLKADQQSCLKSKRGDLSIKNVQALVPLEALPVKPYSQLTLYTRESYSEAFSAPP